MANETDEAFGYDWVGLRKRVFLDSPDQLYEAHIFPLSVVGKGGFELYSWIGGYKSFWQSRADNCKDEDDKRIAEAHVKNADAFGLEIKDTLEQYQISYVELDKDLGSGLIEATI